MSDRAGGSRGTPLPVLGDETQRNSNRPETALGNTGGKVVSSVTGCRLQRHPRHNKLALWGHACSGTRSRPTCRGRRLVVAASLTCSSLSDSSKADREQPRSRYKEQGSRQHQCQLREMNREAVPHAAQTSEGLKHGLRLVSVRLIFGSVHLPQRWKGRGRVHHQVDKH